jgi:uncharacterized membrane protein YfcA
MNWQLVLAGFLIAFIIGLTGMGGGALMTPVLVLFFGVAPLAAVSSDLVASLVMKPVAAAVHFRRRTVQLPLVRLLCYGSVPAAFCSAFALSRFTDQNSVQAFLRPALGIALLLAVVAMVARMIMTQRTRSTPDGGLTLRPVVTVLIGVVGGVIVGLTSVGSGSLIIASLSLLYPGLRAGRLVGTDIVQAIPLVGAAALGHLLFGDVHFDLTAAILLGALPGVFLGARLSSAERFGMIRPVLVIVLIASGLALLRVSNTILLSVVAAAAGLAVLGWLVQRQNEHGAYLREG